ncbi:MAG: type IV secretory system conjugative DNA transfer family protein, partial [Ruminiclostridium sp.]
MKVFKIIATLAGCVLAAVVSVFASYSLDIMLTTQKLQLFDFNTCLEGLKANEKQQQLFLIFTALLIGLIIFIVFVAMKNKYKADTITITPKIKIPVPAGEGQNGSARFLSDSEKRNVFATYRLNQSSDICRVLNRNGDDYYKAAAKDNKYIPYIKVPIEKINRKELPSKGGLVVGMKKHGSYEEISYISKDYHSLIFGATGSGKTRTLVLQSIIFTAMAGEGIVVNDPKGEIYYYTHRVLQSLGYEVIVMDLQNPEKSCSKNLLQPIIDAVNEKKTDKAQRATWDLIEMLVPKSDKGEPIWTNGEKAIIGACVLAVVCDNAERPQYQNLTNVYYFNANMV